MRLYKDTFVAKGSALAQALDAKDDKLAKRVYDDTTASYEATYPKADRDWFFERQKLAIGRSKEVKLLPHQERAMEHLRQLGPTVILAL